MKAGFTVWQVEKLLCAMHILFHIVPATRDDYINVTVASSFPLPFCGHRWVENIPVAERAIEAWSVLQIYVDVVKKKKVLNPDTV